jgi:hypothetical protein
MRIKLTTINSLLVKFPAIPEFSGSRSGMSGHSVPEYPGIYPEFPSNCSPVVDCSESGVSGSQCPEYPDIYPEYPGTL